MSTNLYSFLACQGPSKLSWYYSLSNLFPDITLRFFLSIMKLRSSTDEKENVKPQEERKFIVFDKNLLSLFASCPICAGPAEGHIAKVIGTMVKINQWCADEKSCSCLKCGSASHFLKDKCLVVTYLVSLHFTFGLVPSFMRNIVSLLFKSKVKNSIPYTRA